MTATVFSSPTAAVRIARATSWLEARSAGERVVVVAAGIEAAADLVRGVVARKGAAFGWYRRTLGGLAVALATDLLASRGLVPVGAVGVEALVARVVGLLASSGGLGRFSGIARLPGFPSAIARTIRDLRLAGLGPPDVREVSPDVARVQDAYETELARDGMVDRASVLQIASEVARDRDRVHLLLGVPTLFLDVPVGSALEGDLVGAIAARSPDVLATVPVGDERSLPRLAAALDSVPEGPAAPEHPDARPLARLQAWLFEEGDPPVGTPGDDVVLLSAPGESRECVELVRHARTAAERGVPFDRIAILPRSLDRYRAHLAEALRRADIPAHFTGGTRKPDPAGRALLALLACAAEGLSAHRFAEYLSLGEVPETPREIPPMASAATRFLGPDQDLLPEAIARAARTSEPPEDPECGAMPAAGQECRAHARWEDLLDRAAVIRGRERFTRRLGVLETELRLDLEALEKRGDPGADGIRRVLADASSLRDFASPLLEVLESFAEPATWGGWIERLRALASSAIRHPDRVLSILDALAPMAPLGPADLEEVRLVLAMHLGDVDVAPDPHREGKVFVAAAGDARGLSFDVVLVPGLAERVFPLDVSEDPILRDDARARLGADLETSADRVLGERLALRLAVGAASSKLVLSYPRLDVERSRPRVPSFYGLEVLRSVEGTLPGLDDLARQAERVGAAHVGWPAPSSPEDALDEAEHDLSLLRPVLGGDREAVAGAARYLLGANPHLGRALRFRARRWLRRWTPADGLVEPSDLARAALAEHRLDARSFSPTALQTYAACPYRFLLHAIHRLAPREVPESIEEMDPLQRGTLVHEVQFEFLETLRLEGLLPVTRENLPTARRLLDETLDRVAARTADSLAPAIPRVWEDDIASLRADLREMLRRAAEGSHGWCPVHFELSFGLTERRPCDPASRAEPVALDCGILLRGSVDLVEEHPRSGALRVTDYKTGKVRAEEGAVVGGGELLQPVFYALALEKVFPERSVESGRLYYCTTRGGFSERVVALDERARGAARTVADTVRGAIEEGFLPAAPAKGACRWCDYLSVCGPHEERRTARKPPKRLSALRKLRGLA